jgi:hypothetical protein
MKRSNLMFASVIVQGFFISCMLCMPTVEVPAASQGDAPSVQAMPATTAPFALPPEAQVSTATGQSQGGMPTVAADGKVAQLPKQDKKKSESPGKNTGDPGILQMKELKIVDEGLKGVNKVIDLFVGPFEDFGDVIPPTISSLFGPVAHLHWSLIIRSLQKRIKKAQVEFAVLTGKPKPVEVKPKKPEKPVDYMAAMQQEVKKKEPEQKKKINVMQFMPKPLLKKIYEELLLFVKKATHPIEKKSLIVAELFEPLPPIPFLATVSDVQIALHILSLQQRAAVIEESLKNKLESLDDIKKRQLKGAVKVVDLDPMVAMASAPEPTPEQKKADEKKKKEEQKKEQKPSLKLKDTKQAKTVYSAFKSLNDMVSPMTQSIEKLAYNIPAMPIPLISFLSSLTIIAGGAVAGTGAVLSFSALGLSVGVPVVLIGAAIAVFGSALHGVSQTQFAIYVRNLQQLLGKIEGDIKNYQEAKKLASQPTYDPTKVLEQAQTEMAEPSTQEAAAIPEASDTQDVMPDAQASAEVVDAASSSDAGGAVPAE